MKIAARVGLTCAAALLSACATQTAPPESPTTTQIASVATELAAANIDPGAYAAIGLTLAQRSCAAWFSSQVVEAQQSRFGGQALTVLGGVAAAAGGPAGVGAAVGASALANILGAYQANSPAGLNPAATYGLIARIQQAWVAAMPTPLTTADAYQLVEAFSEQCNLPNIQSAVTQALNTVPVSAAAPISAPPPVALTAPAAPPMSQPQSRAKTSQAARLPRAQSQTIQPSSSLQQERPFTARIPRVTIGQSGFH
jgi:hypothetical protein